MADIDPLIMAHYRGMLWQIKQEAYRALGLPMDTNEDYAKRIEWATELQARAEALDVDGFLSTKQGTDKFVEIFDNAVTHMKGGKAQLLQDKKKPSLLLDMTVAQRELKRPVWRYKHSGAKPAWLKALTVTQRKPSERRGSSGEMRAATTVIAVGMLRDLVHG